MTVWTTVITDVIVIVNKRKQCRKRCAGATCHSEDG